MGIAGFRPRRAGRHLEFEDQRDGGTSHIPASLPALDDAALVWILDPYYSEGFPPRSPAQELRIRIVSP